MESSSFPGYDALLSGGSYDAAKDFEHVFEVMSRPSFLHMTGLGGEQPFYICDYPAERELEVRGCIDTLAARLRTTKYADGSPAPSILRIDLFDSVCEFLRRRGVLERVIALEPRRHTRISSDPMLDGFLGLLVNMVNATTNNLYDFLAEHYDQAFKNGEADIVFITGIGAVYPYVRGHTLLNNLQGRIEDSPLVMFFPGTYAQSSASGSSMRLYDRIEAENYYRAKNIRDVSVIS